MMRFLGLSRRSRNRRKGDEETGPGSPEKKEDEQSQLQGSEAEGERKSRSRKWWRCGVGGADEEADEEKKAYKQLIKDLGWAEESDRNLFNAAWVGTEVIVISGLAAAMACTLTLEPMKSQRLYGLRMWQYVVMATTLFAGLSIVRLITKSVFGPILKSKWMLHRDLGYFLREMKTSVDVTLWLCTVLFAWYVWFRPRLKHVYKDVSVVLAHQLTRFLIAVCLGSLLWVAKDALFFWLEADLHYRQLCLHIKRTICQLHVLQIILKFNVWKFLNKPTNKKTICQLLEQIQNAESEKVKKDRENGRPADPKAKSQKEEEAVRELENEGRNICKELLEVKRENVPVWILRRLCEEYMDQIQTRPLPVTKDVIQNPEELMTEALKLFRMMKPAPHSDSDDDEVKLVDLEQKYGVESKDLELFMMKINQQEKSHGIDANLQNDKKLGGREFHSSVGGDCKMKCDYLVNNNNKEVKEEAEIGRDEFCSWAVVAYRNCWGLRSTLESSERIILKLNRMMMVFVLILALIIWLLLSEIVDSAQIALLFSPLLAAKFIFSESTKNMFDGLIFALAMHPFNPGDRVIVHGMELLVMEINILSTKFYKYQSGEELVYPNSELATTHIINLENIPDQSDQIEFTLGKETSLEDIRELEVKIQISLDYRKDAFKTKVVKTEMGLDTIKMTVQFNYVGSYFTSQMKAEHRSEMLSKIMHLEKKLPSSNQKEKIPSTCKPYIVDVILYKKVKLEHIQTIKEAIQGSLSECYKGGKCKFKVVLNNVTGKHVRMAFYVWNTSWGKEQQQQHLPSEALLTENLGGQDGGPPDLLTQGGKEQHEIILVRDLDHIQDCIFGRILQNYKHTAEKTSSAGKGQPEAEATSSHTPDHNRAGCDQSSVFAHVRIQTKPGVAEIIYPRSDNNNVEDSTKTKFYNVEDVEAVIKRYFCKKCYQYELEVKIMDKLVHIYAWRQFPHGIEEENHQLGMQHILEDNLKDINLELIEFHKQRILDENLEEMSKLDQELAPTQIKKIVPGFAEIECLHLHDNQHILEQGTKRHFDAIYNHNDHLVEFEVKIEDKLLYIYAWSIPGKQHQHDLQQILETHLEQINNLEEFTRASAKIIKIIPGVAEIEYPKSDKEIVENVIKRHLRKNYNHYEFEVDIKEKHLYIYSWRQFPHGVEEVKHPLDMQQILEDINKLEELTRVSAKIKVQVRQGSRENPLFDNH